MQRTHEKLQQAAVVLYLVDLANESPDSFRKEEEWLLQVGKPFIVVGNKIDQATDAWNSALRQREDVVRISAQDGENLDGLRTRLIDFLAERQVSSEGTVVTNVRHHSSLLHTQTALDSTLEGLNNGISHDFLAQDIRHALYHLGAITGQITNDDLLDNIFSKFCIGK